MQLMTANNHQVDLVALQVLADIQAWEHWHEIEIGVAKEYGMSKEQFQKVVPEYWKFLGLIALGHRYLGMFSESVDQIWHTHILNTRRYEQFCLSIYGRMIHHAPNLSLQQRESECNEICSGISCDSACATEDPIPVPPKPGENGNLLMDAQQFYKAYTSTYGPLPRDIWKLPSVDNLMTAL